MKVDILLFASVAEDLGTGLIRLDLPADITAAGLAAALQAAAPAGVALPPLRVAVNQEFVDGRLDLRDGDEVAVIPPVAGG